MARHGTEPLVVVKLNLLVIADRPDFLALLVDFLRFKALNAVFGTELSNLQSVAPPMMADAWNTIEDNLDFDLVAMMVVLVLLAGAILAVMFIAHASSPIIVNLP